MVNFTVLGLRTYQIVKLYRKTNKHCYMLLIWKNNNRGIVHLKGHCPLKGTVSAYFQPIVSSNITSWSHSRSYLNSTSTHLWRQHHFFNKTNLVATIEKNSRYSFFIVNLIWYVLKIGKILTPPDWLLLNIEQLGMAKTAVLLSFQGTRFSFYL